MRHRSFYQRVFGVGPPGLAVTIVIWGILYLVGNLLGIPPMNIGPLIRLLLIIMFIIDLIYLAGGSFLYLHRGNWGRAVVHDGPFLFVRHPLYSAFIYSLTGLLAIWCYSWTLIIAVAPLAIFWSWLVRYEEDSMLKMFGNEYRHYSDSTGQFFPLLSTLNEKFK